MIFRLVFQFFVSVSINTVLYEGYIHRFVLGKKKTHSGIFYLFNFYLFGVISFKPDACTHCETYNPILRLFFCTHLLCIHDSSDKSGETNALDLKTVVKFSTRKGGGVLESMEDEKHLKKNNEEFRTYSVLDL